MQKNKTIIGLLIISLILVSGCGNEQLSEETNYPCAEGRECIDVCGGTLLVMQQGECEIGCTIYNGKLVGFYELKYALESCKED